MRVFIAIAVSALVERELHLVKGRLPDSPIIRETNSFHLTIRFLGNLDHEEVEELLRSMEGMRFSPFSLTLDGMGAFPDWERPRVLWVGCQPSKELENLQYAILQRTKHIGEPENVQFHPHLTLARLTSKLPDEDIATVQQISVKPLSWTVDKVIVYDSELTMDGLAYKEIATVNAA